MRDRLIEPDISIIIPTYNRAEKLAECLKALERQSLPSHRFEVMVADDGSSDDTRRVLEERRYSFALHSLFLPHGGANAARNRGAKEASGTLLTFLGDDMLATSDLLDAHLEAHRSHPQENVGVVGRIDWSPKLFLTPFLHFLSEPDCSFQFGFSGFDPNDVPLGRMYGSHHSVKRSFFERHGGFDEKFVLPAFDDIELECRYRKTGFRLVYEPRARLYHDHRYDLRTFARRMRMVGRAAVRLYRKHPESAALTEIDTFLALRVEEAELERRIIRLEKEEERLEKIWGASRWGGWSNTEGYARLKREWNDVLMESMAVGAQQEAEAGTFRNTEDAALTGNEEMKPVTFPRSGEAPEVSIIIPVHGLLDYTRRCLSAIKENTAGRFEVIVVDGNSPDETRPYLRRCAGVRLVELGSNPGFSVACNRGAVEARGEYLIFLNNDTIPLKGWLSALRKALESNPIVWIAGAKLLYPDKRVQHSGIGFKDGQPFHLHHLTNQDDPVVGKTSFVWAVTGACIMMKRDNFLFLRGFDERYRNGYEDVDLCLKAARRGFKTIYCAESVLYHFTSQTPGRFDYDAENSALFKNCWEGWLMWHSMS